MVIYRTSLNLLLGFFYNLDHPLRYAVETCESKNGRSRSKQYNSHSEICDLRIVVRRQKSTTLKRPANDHSCDFPIRHARTA